MKKDITIIKYLLDLTEKYRGLKSGINANSTLWNTFGITPDTIEEHIKKIYAMGIEIESLKYELSKKLSEARELRNRERKIIEQFEKRAVGLHADEEEKLSEYSIDK